MSERRLDLLRDRRIELGLSPQPARLRSARSLLIVGGSVGSLITAIMILAFVLLQGKENILQDEVNRLQPVEQRTQVLQGRLKRASTASKKLDAETRRIVAQLVSVRSGSAFLEQLRSVTPQEVEMQNISVSSQQIRVEGITQMPGGFVKINSLLLNFQELPEVPEGGATVRKAVADDDGFVEFSLTVDIDPSVKSTKEQLEALGADGLASRYAMLQEQEMPF